MRVGHRRHENLEGVRLRLRQRRRHERLRIEAALPRVLDQPILGAVVGVACGEDGFVDLGDDLRRHMSLEEGFGVLVASELGMIVHVGRAGDDTVIVVWIAHRLHQPHVAAERAAVEISSRHTGRAVEF